VARNVWQPIGAAMPAAAARRRIMHQASGWAIGGNFTHDRERASEAGRKGGQASHGGHGKS
jgi:general stress protein YciG